MLSINLRDNDLEFARVFKAQLVGIDYDCL